MKPELQFRFYNCRKGIIFKHFFLVLCPLMELRHVKKGTNSKGSLFKGTVSRDFRPLIFFIKQSHLGPNSRVKIFSNMASNSRSYSTKLVPEWCQWHRSGQISDFKVEYLREFQAICKKALTRVSGAKEKLFGEKTRGWKSRDTVPLNLDRHLIQTVSFTRLLYKFSYFTESTLVKKVFAKMLYNACTVKTHTILIHRCDRFSFSIVKPPCLVKFF
jgi:hypothetical protein